MKFTYDPRYNIAYMRFREKGHEVESIRISDELIVDLAPNGSLYGIELLIVVGGYCPPYRLLAVVAALSPRRPMGQRTCHSWWSWV